MQLLLQGREGALSCASVLRELPFATAVGPWRVNYIFWPDKSEGAANLYFSQSAVIGRFYRGKERASAAADLARAATHAMSTGESETLTAHQRILRTQQPEEVYLNLVLEFVPETIYRIIKHYSRTKRQVPGLYVKVRAANRAQKSLTIHPAPPPPRATLGGTQDNKKNIPIQRGVCSVCGGHALTRSMSGFAVVHVSSRAVACFYTRGVCVCVRVPMRVCVCVCVCVCVF